LEETCASDFIVSCHIYPNTDLDRLGAFEASKQAQIILEQAEIRLVVPWYPHQLPLPNFLRD
jgi:hypothetical protein